MASRWLLVSMCLAACGDDAGRPPDASVDAPSFGEPSDVYPAFRPPVAQIHKSPTGSVIAAPRVVQAYFADDTEAATLQDFVGKLAASSYWSAMVGEYGVGSLTVAAPVSIAMNAPTTATSDEIRAFIADQLDGTHAEWGAVDATTLASTIILLHYPLGSTVFGGGPNPPESCKNMGGFHGNVPLTSGARVAFALTISCNLPAGSHFATHLDAITSLVTHETVEAATNPLPPGGYVGVDAVSYAWAYVHGAELSDVCEAFPTTWIKPSDLGYTLPRSWSNASARDYHNPCVPIPPEDSPYFATAPVQPDTIDVDSFSALGTRVSVGVPRTIDVQFLSDAPTTGDWTVEALDDRKVNGLAPVLSLSLDRATGRNGNISHLTITAMSRPASGFTLYRLRSTLAPTSTDWYGLVGIDP